MIYLQKLKTKLFLIVLSGLILINISFISSKSYTAVFRNYKITNGTEEQYQSCLGSLSNLEAKTIFIANTKIKYLFYFPEQSLLIIYLGYFLIASAFILSAKVNLKESDNGNK